jgi:putative ABC transport system substrate-binding protein
MGAFRISQAASRRTISPSDSRLRPGTLRPHALGRSGMGRRRFLLTSLSGALIQPLVAFAQPAGKIPRIGIRGNVPVTEPYGAALWGAFILGLRELGYVDGRTVAIEHLSSEGNYERLPALAEELVRRHVDVIVAPADQNALAVQKATRTIPIVMIGDPERSGLAASLARPGGNVTELSTYVGPEIAGKQLEPTPIGPRAAPRCSRRGEAGACPDA